MLRHEETKVGEFYLLVVEKEPGFYRLYVGTDGEHYTHYDSGNFENLKDALKIASRNFDPEPFNLFPYAPFVRAKVLEDAPHGFESLSDYMPQQKG